ncbi:hypothetical protein NQ315_010659, partial [Exocentrus adspersus]
NCQTWLHFSLPIVVAALVLSAAAVPLQDQDKYASPCPSLFDYDSLNETGRWTGTLTLESDAELHGIWIRMIFNSRPTEVTAPEGYTVILDESRHNEVVVKNRDVLLKAEYPAKVKITVKYDGDKFPSLIEYRLNAETVCSSKPSVNDKRPVFNGDKNAFDLLQTALATNEESVMPADQCGGTHQSDAYPWQAAVYLKREGEGNEQYICGGTLISPSHILLPAHCVAYKDSYFKVPERKVLVTLPGVQGKLKVKNIRVHRGYSPSFLENDLAVLKINPVQINDDVTPICLDTDNCGEDSRKLLLVGKAIETDGTSNDTQVVEANVEVADCEAGYPELGRLRKHNNFCVTYVPEENSKCVGYSGSTLISVKNNVPILKGLVIVGPILQQKADCSGSTTTLILDPVSLSVELPVELLM